MARGWADSDDLGTSAHATDLIEQAPIAPPLEITPGVNQLLLTRDAQIARFQRLHLLPKCLTEGACER